MLWSTMLACFLILSRCFLFFFFFNPFFFQLEDVSRHSWVTQYVNGEQTPIHRRNRLPISSTRSTPPSSSLSIKRKANCHSSSSSPSPMFVNSYICLLVLVLICFPPACSSLSRLCVFCFVVGVHERIKWERKKNVYHFACLHGHWNQ